MNGTPRRRATDASNGDAGERLARLEERMDQVEDGVTNFRNFQAEARQFFSDSKTRDEEKIKYQADLAKALEMREKKADRWWKLILTWVLIVGGLLGLGQYIAPVVKHWLNLPQATLVTPKDQSSAQESKIPTWRQP